MNPLAQPDSLKRRALDAAIRTLTLVFFATHAADFNDPNADRNALPTVPPGFQVSFFAREPLVRQPCSMAFDAQGRLCVGMGPQYRNPTPDTPGDSVVLVLDPDQDGKADFTKTFATGFNAIQGLAWHGRDLWVANAPDLTVVRDLDGDDHADEYIRIYTDLGNLEHGLHGLNWAPDGALYMSKGNSKGLTEPGRVAPKPFRDLWGVTAPRGSPDFPTPTTNSPSEYRRAYHDPEDDWGREGGVLRCEDGGHNLEIVARGFRNPWDIAFDSGFNWLGTDNDQTTGDRVFMPFFGAHFGWNHPWSAHWSAAEHPPTAPVSGPLFEGSGTGVLFGDSPQFPRSHRGVFLINDWLRKTTFVWRPRWEGALLRPVGGDWEPFIRGGSALFRPTDLEFGPDGALWILGWGSGYGAEYENGELVNEGRIFRLASTVFPPTDWQTPKRAKPLTEWSISELLADFDGPLPVWRSNAQEELVRRGLSVKSELTAAVSANAANDARETWIAWTLGRLSLDDRSIDEWFTAKLSDAAVTLNLRVQALRILAYRIRRAGGDRPLPAEARAMLLSAEPRLRFEAVQAIGQVRERPATPELLELIDRESDPTTYYAAWQTLSRLHDSSALKGFLADPRAAVRRAALLALLESGSLRSEEVSAISSDRDSSVREIASLWLSKAAQGGERVALRGRALRFIPEPSSSPRIASLVKNLRARSGASYRLAATGLHPGARPYTDRGYTLLQVPPRLEGADFIQTANNDDGSHGDAWLSFEVRLPTRVHVALDTRTRNVPEWIRSGYRRSDQLIQADHWTFQLYIREFPTGLVQLGGNTQNGEEGGKGNYIVVLEPLPPATLSEPTSAEATLSLLAQGDRDQGQLLFHHRGGAGCFNCHRLDEHGNQFGPDLAGIGDRATAQHIVQSMLEPNSVVTEGFQFQWVETADGEHSGILLEESGFSLTLGLATGQKQVFSKSQIRSRRSDPTSAMPAYDRLLAPRAVADLTAYLMAQKADSTAPSAANREGFSVAQESERLVITHSGKPVADFVFRDARILRPYLANVYAPNGLKVTRNHPPIAGVDATDHETMHPGISLGFGDINGIDFWRNQGRIEHIRFVEPPEIRAGRLRFATESRLQAPDGRTLGSTTNRLTLSILTNAWLLIWEATFRSDAGELVFGDQEEMGFSARVASAITEKNGGEILSSTGTKSAAATWGNAYNWCDYSGIIQNQRVGITLFASLKNFHPSWWHNRDYGVFVANPFGRAAMKKGAPSSVAVPGGQSFHLCFGALIHSRSQRESEDLASGYEAFLATD